MCIHEGCKTQPSFNIIGELKALYCSAHKQEGMVDVKNKTCIHEGCKKQPVFNIDGETKALYCSAHKQEGMVDVKHETCIHEGCKKRPHFNIDGELKALYCSVHKQEGMVDVKHATCIHEGCKTRPHFNIDGETKSLYCSVHKQEGMVNIISKTCIHEGCKTRPHFNIDGETKALYCSLHKQEGMVNVTSKTCIHEGCKKQPVFNIDGETKALYCSAHKQEGMVDVKHETCKSEWCLTLVKKKYDGYCLYCYMNIFPDKPVSRNYKTKEYAVVEYVKQHILHKWIADKTIMGGCSKRRPDLLLDLNDQVIIIEIDEDKHINYDCSCENKRLMELSQDIGHRPIVFIRFNPDSYNKKGTKISSCWSINKNGICVVNKSKQDEWIERLNVLVEHANYWIHNRTNKTIEIIQLFYDI